MLAILLAAVVTCAGVDDTAALQAAIYSDQEVTIQGDCVVRGQPGLRVPSDRDIRMYGATLTQTPNVGGVGPAGRNRIFETVVGSSRIKLRGGRLVGRRNYVGGLEWSIGIHVDSATDVVIEDVQIENFYTDGLKINGNPPGSSNVVVRNVRVSNSKRNALSITCGRGIRILSSVFETTNCVSDAVNGVCSPYEVNMPMCGIDFEPNAGDEISDVVVMDSVFRGNQKCGVFLQSNWFTGGDVVFYNNRFEDNVNFGFAGNQITGLYLIKNKAQGGKLGYTFGAGLVSLVFVDNEVQGTSDFGVRFAGVRDPFASRNKMNGRPVGFVAITSPVNMNGVSGDVSLKGLQ